MRTPFTNIPSVDNTAFAPIAKNSIFFRIALQFFIYKNFRHLSLHQIVQKFLYSFEYLPIIFCHRN